MSMVGALTILLVSLLVLVLSAEIFTRGASSLARILGVSPLMVGLTVVAIGSSAPEIFISAVAALADKPDIAVGNALGSNITNIALVLGITALVMPLDVDSRLLKRELPFLMLVTVLLGGLFANGYLGRLEGVALLVAFVLFMIWLIKDAKGEALPMVDLDTSAQPVNDNMLLEAEIEAPEKQTRWITTIFLLIGIVGLPISAHYFVDAASIIARDFGVSEWLIGITIVALGTSLPELATSLVSAIKREHEMALGNIVGSNIFNSLAVVGIAGSFSPATLNPLVLLQDYWVVVFFTVVMVTMGIGFSGRRAHISRLEGALLLCGFVAYYWWIWP